MAHNNDLEINTNTEPNNNPVHEAVQFFWGERCPDHEDGCVVCSAWAQYDRIAKYEEILTKLLVAMAKDNDVLRVMTTKKSMADAVVAMKHLWE